MINSYLPVKAKIISVKDETENIKLYRLKFVDARLQRNFHFWNGQFVMAGLPGFGEGVFNICSEPQASANYFELAVRKVGNLTTAMHDLKLGDTMEIRGPFGNGWPVMKSLGKKNIVLVAGGCGFIAIRSVINELAKTGYAKEHKVQVFYGTTGESHALFAGEYQKWQVAGIELRLIFDKEPPKHAKYEGASCSHGLVTHLLAKENVAEDATAFVCGPEVIFKLVAERLKTEMFRDEDIYLSMERKMACATGTCQHCAIGEWYVCENGPTYRYDQVKDYLK